MAKLFYTAITSLDGYVADAEGNFDWSMPDADVHAFINDLERGIGTQLMGRKLYEVMKFWEPLYGRNGPASVHRGLRHDLARCGEDRLLQNLAGS